MKKAIVTLCAIIALSTTLMAEGRIDSVRYLTTKAGQNWFISAQGTLDWWKGSLVTPANFDDYNKINPMAFGGGVSVGKWINHKLALRVAYDVTGANSYILGRHTNLNEIQFLYNGETLIEGDIYRTSFKYHNLHADFMFSPIDFFQGYYNPNRLYTPVIYVGLGCAAVSNNVFVIPTLINNIQAQNYQESESYDINDPQKTKEGLNFELSFDAGLMNNLRINDYLDLNIELKYSLQRWNIDSWFNEYQGVFYNDGTPGVTDPNNHNVFLADADGNMPNRIRPNRVDQNFAVGLGLTYFIGGRVYELPYNYEKEMKEMRDRIKNLEDELAAVPAPVETPADTVYINISEIEAISYPFSIFFNLDSYQLMSKRDLVNLRELATVAKEQGYKLRLRGSCDSATATPEYNQKLSENRCRKIQEELINMGFPESDIVLEPVGGVKELDPTEFDRRVLVDIIKYNDRK